MICVMRRSKKEAAHDVLAAEEFGVPAPDPRLKVEPVRDVLAAEEFGVPAPDPQLHHDPPRDVLAADEFPVPAPPPDEAGAAAQQRDWPPRVAIAVAGLLLVGGVAAKLRRRPKS
jgi:hypothetical protein